MDLDKKDLAILRELDLNVRASYSQIGRKTRISKETVQYRIKNLEKRKILTGYWAVPKIGNNSYVYKILLKNKNMTEDSSRAFVRYLSQSDAVAWLASTEGNWDYIVTCIVSADHLFSSIMTSLLEGFGSQFKERHVLKCTEFISLNEKYLHDRKSVPIHAHHDNLLVSCSSPDQKDKEIIKEISRDARISFTEIGLRVGLTPEAVAYRCRNIFKHHILTLKPRIQHEALGFSYYHLYIELSQQNMYQKIAKFYSAYPNCVFVMRYIGVCDLHVELIVHPSETGNIINELTQNFGEYLNGYELVRVAKEHKIRIDG